jgi:1,4-dihydroxy-2-naphthoate octaprenyltransferase
MSPRGHAAPAPLVQASPSGSGFWRGVWRVADPKITLASVASMLLGSALAAADGPLAWPWLVLTVVGIFCIEAAKNASGEVFDWDSGDDQGVTDEDRSPFSGGKRVLVDGLMTRRQIWCTAMVFYAVGAAAGLAIVAWREPAVLWLGLAGVALAYFYHAPPLALSYHGLGELAVTLVYGPLVCAGTYLVQRQALPAHVWIAAVPLGLMVGAFLWINEFPDRRADEAAGKRTLVVRLGAERAAAAFAGLVAAAYAALVLLPLAGFPLAVWGGLVGLPHGIAAARRLSDSPAVTARIVPAQAWTLLSFVLLSLGASVGLVVTALGR